MSQEQSQEQSRERRERRKLAHRMCNTVRTFQKLFQRTSYYTQKEYGCISYIFGYQDYVYSDAELNFEYALSVFNDFIVFILNFNDSKGNYCPRVGEVWEMAQRYLFPDNVNCEKIVNLLDAIEDKKVFEKLKIVDQRDAIIEIIESLERRG